MPDQEREQHYWRLFIDAGGTFTDAIGISPGGETVRAKVLSSSSIRAGCVRWPDDCSVMISLEGRELPDGFLVGFDVLDDHGGRIAVVGNHAGDRIDLDRPVPLMPGRIELSTGLESPVLAAHVITSTCPGTPLPSMKLRIATTHGTNALLQRSGSPMVHMVTGGFGDLLVIGDQQRPDLFSLRIDRPPLLAERTFEIDERVGADGSVLTPLDGASLAALAAELVADGTTTAAVSFMHAWAHPEHERAARKVLLEAGFEHVTCSSDISGVARIVPRARTTVINAYLAGPVGRFLDGIRTHVPAGSIHVMSSAGGLQPEDSFEPKDSLLSGPAGGVHGAVAIGSQRGETSIITFDMGGTSTDVARCQGEIEYRDRWRINEHEIDSTAVHIETVAAGGGSIVDFDGEEIIVGPASAGARPGPACYGMGGPLTITDVNLLAGRLDPTSMPLPIDMDAAERALSRILRLVNRSGDRKIARDDLLLGALEIANETMAGAIRVVSASRGFDPADSSLVAFGGAGGQHAIALAGSLSINRVIIPSEAGLLSARGLATTAIQQVVNKSVLQVMDGSIVRSDVLEPIEEDCLRRLVEAAGRSDHVRVARRIGSFRILGQDGVVQIEIDKTGSLREPFQLVYARIHGHEPPEGSVEIESIRVIGEVYEDHADTMEQPCEQARTSCERSMSMLTADGPVDARVLDRDAIAGEAVSGPMIILDTHATTVIEPGWEAFMDEHGSIIAEKVKVPCPESRPLSPVAVELQTAALTDLATTMGRQLERTSLSTNIKERLDFSCAILDPAGGLVVNAPHMPVHLGALGVCVRRLAEVIRMEPADTVICNHPAFGGSHLPDITLVTPAHDANGRLLGYVASRAHHAEIGGSRPGSMPPDAISLEEEGVVIEPMHLVERGRDRFDRLLQLLKNGPWPSRQPASNIADVRAQLAANALGVQGLVRMAGRSGTDVLLSRMALLQERAARKTRQRLAMMPDGVNSASEQLDDGSLLVASIAIDGERMEIDFTGTSDVHPRNFNATEGIVNSVVLYVLRLMIDEPMPLNEGMLEPVRINLPHCMLNPGHGSDPGTSPAVAAGNTETSQRLVDLLLKALGIVACSQGTMNNLLLGNKAFSYYETICGGTGAGDGFDGVDAVHSHMTNTRITDPEILEHRYPLRLEQFRIRRDSGGAGLHNGGDGVIRGIRFLQDMDVSVISQHRNEGPYGLHGGRPGMPGFQELICPAGDRLEYPGGVCAFHGPKGAVLTIHTPGGGGWKAPPPCSDTIRTNK